MPGCGVMPLTSITCAWIRKGLGFGFWISRSPDVTSFGLPSGLPFSPGLPPGFAALSAICCFALARAGVAGSPRDSKRCIIKYE